MKIYTYICIYQSFVCIYLNMYIIYIYRTSLLYLEPLCPLSFGLQPSNKNNGHFAFHIDIIWAGEENIQKKSNPYFWVQKLSGVFIGVVVHGGQKSINFLRGSSAFHLKLESRKGLAGGFASVPASKKAPKNLAKRTTISIWKAQLFWCQKYGHSFCNVNLFWWSFRWLLRKTNKNRLCKFDGSDDSPFPSKKMGTPTFRGRKVVHFRSWVRAGNPKNPAPWNARWEPHPVVVPGNRPVTAYRVALRKASPQDQRSSHLLCMYIYIWHLLKLIWNQIGICVYMHIYIYV